MANNTVGTPEKVTLDGITFDVMGDANFSAIKGRFENENVPTSGKNVQKKTARSQNVESVTLQCNAEEAELLKELSERKSAFPMSYETAAGDVFRSNGGINFGSHETESGTATVTLLPEDRDGFVAFIA